MFNRPKLITQWLLIRRRSAKSTSLQNVKLENVKAENQFRLKLNDQYAFIEYERKNGTYDLVRTEVPPAYAGRGIATLIAKKTFQYIISEKKRMILSCDFLRSYFMKHGQQYRDYIER